MSQASHEFKGSVDFNQNELRNATFQRLITPPISPVQAQIYYNTPIQVPFYWNTTKWLPFGLPPVHIKYVDETALLADQVKQIEGYIYHDITSDIYYEKLETSTGDILVDYNPFGGSGTSYVHPAYSPISQTLSGATVLASFSSDSIGSVTGLTTRTLTPADIGAEPAFTKGSLIQGAAMSVTGTLASRLVGTGDITIAHADTSTQASITNTNGTIIQSLGFDTYGHVTSAASLDGDVRWLRNIEVLSTQSLWSHVTLQSGIDLTPYTTGSSGYPSTLGYAVAFYANTSDSTSGFGRAFALNRAYNTENYYLGSPNTSGVHNGWRLIYHDGNLNLGTLGGTPTTRTLTINGVTQDLSADRTFNVGIVHSLTTTGNSGAATLISNVLNIPNYTLAGLGGIGGTIADGQVAFGTGANTIGGDSGLTYSTGILTISSVQPYLVLSDTTVGDDSPYLVANTGSFYINFNTPSGIANKFRVYSDGRITLGDAKWDVLSTGIFRSNGAQTIQTSTGNLTLATGGGNGNIILSPNGTGNVGISTTPTQKLDLNGNIRVRALTTTEGDFVQADATGVFQRRTSAQVRTQLGLDASYQRDVFTYVSTNVFTLTQTVLAGLEVFINGQKKRFGVDYTVSGTTLTIVLAQVDLPSYTSAEIEAVYYYSLVGITPAPFTGSGTTNYLTRWLGTSQFGVSLIQDNGSLVTLPAATDISAVAATIDTDKFVVLDSNRFKYRTGSQLLSDIGAQAAGSYVTTSRTLTINGVTLDLSANRTWTIDTGFDAVYDNGNSGAFTLTNGLTQKIVLNGDKTFTFSSPASGKRYEILIHQDATGGRTVTWPELHWRDRQVPSVSTAANAKDKLVMTYDGTLYWAELLKNYGVASDLIIQTNLLFWLDPANTSSYSGSGSAWNDLTANGLGATLVGPTFDGADSGGVFDFDGTNDYATMSATVANSFVGQLSYTVGIWVKPETSPPSQQTVWGINQSETTQSKLQVRINSNGSVRLGYFADDLDSSASAITFGSWNYLVVQYNSATDTSKIYVNGTEVASGSQGGLLAGTSRVVEFGRFNGVEYLKGSIGAVHAYTDVKTPAQIVENFNALKGRYGL